MPEQLVETKETTVSDTTPNKTVSTTSRVVNPAIKTEHPNKVYTKKKVIFRTYQVIWYILAIIEILLGFRVALKAFGANPFSGFADLIYTVSNPLALPFSGILKTTVYGTSVIEWSTLIAALVYLLIAYAIIYLMQLIKPVTPNEVEESVDNT